MPRRKTKKRHVLILWRDYDRSQKWSCVGDGSFTKEDAIRLFASWEEEVYEGPWILDFPEDCNMRDFFLKVRDEAIAKSRLERIAEAEAADRAKYEELKKRFG